MNASGNAKRPTAPSFEGLKPASEASSEAKRHNRRQDTLPEVLLRKHLWRAGLRYRKNVRELPGEPDVVFLRARVVVFCDGDFWHGRDWPVLKTKLQRGTNGSYWTAKIAANMKRDVRKTALLERAGWRVLRFWETDIRADPDRIVQEIKRALQGRGEVNRG